MSPKLGHSKLLPGLFLGSYLVNKTVFAFFPLYMDINLELSVTVTMLASTRREPLWE